ncbi:nitroreductase/quinone reductase family protein [Streptomyces sp. NPDC053429]|uniref:nitroreductase/quinone reductase family protein n=1 Tax=Streptomyces sp. NPDC053429 TaxID=3365702 RepID=UPI0037CE40F2
MLQTVTQSQTLTVDWDHPADPRPGRALDHVRAYVASGGLDGHLWHGVPTLLLTTVDRERHRTVRTPLVYVRDGGRHLVVAAGPVPGGPAPHWYAHLVAHPEVRLQVGALSFQATARTADAVERETYWEALTALWPAYEDHQAAAAPREVPLVILDRLAHP